MSDVVESSKLVVQNELFKYLELIAKGVIPTNAKSLGPLSEHHILSHIDGNTIKHEFMMGVFPITQEYTEQSQLVKQIFIDSIKNELRFFKRIDVSASKERLSSSKISNLSLLLDMNFKLLNVNQIGTFKLDEFTLNQYIPSGILRNEVNYFEEILDGNSRVSGRLINAFGYLWNQLHGTTLLLGSGNQFPIWEEFSKFKVMFKNNLTKSDENIALGFWNEQISHILDNFDDWYKSQFKVEVEIKCKIVSDEPNSKYTVMAPFQLGAAFESEIPEESE